MYEWIRKTKSEIKAFQWATFEDEYVGVPVDQTLDMLTHKDYVVHRMRYGNYATILSTKVSGEPVSGLVYLVGYKIHANMTEFRFVVMKAVNVSNYTVTIKTSIKINDASVANVSCKLADRNDGELQFVITFDKKHFDSMTDLLHLLMEKVGQYYDFRFTSWPDDIEIDDVKL